VEKVKPTGEQFCWKCSDDLRAMIEPPSCRQYKPGDFLAVRPLNSDDIIEEDNGDVDLADPRQPSGGRSSPGDGNDNDNGECEEDRHGSAKSTGKGKGTNDGQGKGKGKGKGNGKGEGTVKLYEADSDTDGKLEWT
jgi:hypothetical protein